MASSASSMRGIHLLLMLLLLTSVARMDAVAAVTIDELGKILPVLRSRGYSRFGDAMAATSRLIVDFLSARNLTLFAPSDTSLHALELTLPPDSYLSLLRFHAVPRRLLISDLCLLPSSSLLPTLLPNRSVIVTVRRADVFSVALNDVLLETPGLYYSADVAVYGLAGVLSFRSDPVSGPIRAPEVSSLVNPPQSHRFTILPPAAPPVGANLGPSPTVATKVDPVSAMPHSSQINQALHRDGDLPPRAAPQAAIVPPETSGAVPRRILPIIRRRFWIPHNPTPAPLKIHGHGGQVTSVADEENGHLHQMTPALRVQEEPWPLDKATMQSEDHNLPRPMMKRYVANQYNIQSSPLCADECTDY